MGLNRSFFTEILIFYSNNNIQKNTKIWFPANSNFFFVTEKNDLLGVY